MRPIDHHIYELLLHHDCVVVPALGGFLATRENARIDSVKQTAIPPVRKIAFNIYLRNNDGLLAKRLVETEHVSYPEALQEIEAYVHGLVSALNNGELIVINQVGQLQYDADKNLQFEPDTKSLFLTDSFGLNVLPVHAITIGTHKTKKNDLSQKPSSRKTKVKTGNRSLVSFLALGGALLWFGLNIYIVSKDHYSKASLNLLDNTEVNETALKQKLTPPPVAVKVETVFVAATKPDSTPLSDSTVKIAAVNGVLNANTITAPTPNDQESFYLIAGVFRSKENADRLTAQLQLDGFTGARIVDQKGGKFYVSAASFLKKTEAIEANDSLNKINRSYWVFHR